MIVIDVYSYSNGEIQDHAAAEDPEAALLAARTLWDEAFNGIMGQKRQIVFKVDGKVVRVCEERP